MGSVGFKLKAENRRETRISGKVYRQLHVIGREFESLK